MTATPNKKLLAAQLPIPSHPGDKSEDLVAGGSKVQAAHFQGERPYQEDRYLADALDVTAREARAFLADAFHAAAKKTDANGEGSTGTAMVLTADLQLRAAFLGDSPLVVFIYDPASNSFTARKLTRDHHAALPAEKTRIEHEGGMVASNGRVDGSLMLSRAFGDAGYLGVSRDAEFAQLDIKKEIDAGRQVYICLSSDGLYETLDPKDFLPVLKQAIAEKKTDSIAHIFAAQAHDKGSGDNITALVFKVPRHMDHGLFLAIADGHGGAETSTEVTDSFKASLAKHKSLKK